MTGVSGLHLELKYCKVCGGITRHYDDWQSDEPDTLWWFCKRCEELEHRPSGSIVERL